MAFICIAANSLSSQPHSAAQALTCWPFWHKFPTWQYQLHVRSHFFTNFGARTSDRIRLRHDFQLLTAPCFLVHNLRVHGPTEITEMICPRPYVQVWQGAFCC